MACLKYYLQTLNSRGGRPNLVLTRVVTAPKRPPIRDRYPAPRLLYALD